MSRFSIGRWKGFPFRKHVRKTSRIAAVGVTIALILPRPGVGYTQSVVGVVPMGHEWITRLAALELLGNDPIMKPDPNDPRKTWTRGKAKNPSIKSREAQNEVSRIRGLRHTDSRYKSVYKPIYDAIIGERWVDLGGINPAKAYTIDKHNCFSAVAQEAAEVQYDHFMRRYDDRGGQGGIRAAKRSTGRFVRYFVEAAMAPSTKMRVFDGGVISEPRIVDRNYFLFGRAVHLFQDSFSPEHVVRLPDDGYERVRQVKSYLCAAGAEQHSHDTKDIASYWSGDVIWKILTQTQTGWEGYKPSNMKSGALAATEATKDLWAAFFRTMGTRPSHREETARAEARELARNWLSFDRREMETWYDDEKRRDATYVLASGQSGKGKTVQQCMKTFGKDDQRARVRELEREQRICLYNMVPVTGYADLFDPAMHLHYSWGWRSSTSWVNPPQDWKIPQRRADTGQRVQIRSVKNGKSMVAPGGIKDDELIYCRDGKALDFIRVGRTGNMYFRLIEDPRLFLSYRDATGAVKLYSSTRDASYRLNNRRGRGWTIFNNTHKQYMWLWEKENEPYVDGSGKPENTNARWYFDKLDKP